LNSPSAKCCLNKIISSRKPFSLPTNYKPVKKGIKCHFIQKIGLQYANPKDVTDNLKITDKWKLLIPRAPIAGQTDFSKPVGFYYNGNTRIAKPGEICTESWLVACSFRTEEEVLSFKSYLFTKIARFLLLQTVVSQDITRERFVFIPYIEKYDTEFTDEILRKRWNITDEEWDFIDSKIKTIEL
jgi:site-specific DNA-methyltransferase (adenine-specific)